MGANPEARTTAQGSLGVHVSPDRARLTPSTTRLLRTFP